MGLAARPMMVVTANIPMTMGSSEKPSIRETVPKVKRGMLSTGATPTNVVAIPNKPARIALRILPPLMQMIRISAKVTREKNSKLPSFTA